MASVLALILLSFVPSLSTCTEAQPINHQTVMTFTNRSLPIANVVISIQATDLYNILQSNSNLKHESCSKTQTFFQEFSTFVVTFDMAATDLHYMARVLNEVAMYNKHHLKSKVYNQLHVWISTAPDFFLGYEFDAIIDIIQEANSICSGTVSNTFYEYDSLKSTSRKTPVILEKLYSVPEKQSYFVGSNFNVWHCQRNFSSLKAPTHFSREKCLLFLKLQDIHAIKCVKTIDFSTMDNSAIKVTVNLTRSTYKFNQSLLHSTLYEMEQWKAKNYNFNATMIVDVNVVGESHAPVKCICDLEHSCIKALKEMAHTANKILSIVH